MNRRLLVLIFSVLFICAFLAWHLDRINSFRSTLVDQLENYRRDENFVDFDSFVYSDLAIPSLETIRKELNDVQGPDERIIKEFIENDDSFTYKPPLKFLENLTNPCWLQSVPGPGRPEKILCLPYFYLAGFPKCGTTDLWHRLHVLNSVVSTSKEPHWWTRWRYNDDDYRGGDMSMYTRYFRHVDPTVPWQITGDGSQSTIWDDLLIQEETDTTKLSSEAGEALSVHGILPIHLINQYTPNAKYIFLLRNPVDRLYSGYLYFSRKSSEPLSQEDFHERATEALRGMLTCMRRHGIRQCAYSGRMKKKYGSTMRIGVCMYVVFINDLLKTVPIKNVLILTLNEYSLRRTAVLKRVTDFLEVKVDDVLVEKMDSLEMANTRPENVQIGPMLPRTRVMLQQFFHPFNQALAEFMNDESLAVHAPEARDLAPADEEEDEDEDDDNVEE